MTNSNSLSVNMAISSENEKQKAFVCDLCETVENVNYHCMECCQNFCASCNMKHSRFKSARAHSVVNIHLWEVYQHDVRCYEHPICPEHPDRVYHQNLFCFNCMEMVCSTCRQNLRHPRPPMPIIKDLPSLSPEEKKLQELYLELEYYKEVERLMLKAQGGPQCSERMEQPMMADKVKEFMRKFAEKIDKVRNEMIDEVNTHYEEEAQKVMLEYSYSQKIGMLEEKIESYNKKLLDHSRLNYQKNANDTRNDQDVDPKENVSEDETKLDSENKGGEEKQGGGEKEDEKEDKEEDKEVSSISKEQEKKESEHCEKPAEEMNKPRLRCRSPDFEPGKVDTEKIKELIQEYLLEGETPELIAKQEALIREMYGRLEYCIIDQQEDGVKEVAKVRNLGREIKDELECENSEKDSATAENIKLTESLSTENNETMKESCSVLEENVSVTADIDTLTDECEMVEGSTTTMADNSENLSKAISTINMKNVEKMDKQEKREINMVDQNYNSVDGQN